MNTPHLILMMMMRMRMMVMVVLVVLTYIILICSTSAMLDLPHIPVGAIESD